MYVEIKDETENEMKEVEVDLVLKWMKQYTNAYRIEELKRTCMEIYCRNGRWIGLGCRRTGCFKKNFEVMAGYVRFLQIFVIF